MDIFDRNILRIRSISLFAALLFLIGCGPSEAEIERRQQAALEEARKWGSFVQKEIQPALNSLHAMTEKIENMLNDGNASRRGINTILRDTLEQHYGYLAVWTCWEPNALDNLDRQYQNKENHDGTGRFIPYWHRSNGQVQVKPLVDYTKEGRGDYYLIPRNSGKETIFNPSIHDVGDQREFKTIMVAPIRFNGRILGVAGIDVSLDGFLFPIVRKIKVYDIGYGFIIANNGVLAAHPTRWANVGKSMGFFNFHPESIEAVREGREAIERKTSKTTGRTIFYIFKYYRSITCLSRVSAVNLQKLTVPPYTSIWKVGPVELTGLTESN